MFRRHGGMIDDTKDYQQFFPISSSRLAGSIEEISKHKTSRTLAKGWARSLRFLTVDEDITNDANKKQLCGGCEVHGNTHLPGHDCSSHQRVGRTRNSNRNLDSDVVEELNACKHVAKVTCKYCQHIPIYPSSGKVTRFRIRRVTPRTLGPRILPTSSRPIVAEQEQPDQTCGHYIAVSYCWSATQDSDAHYTVVEEDGSVRRTRASTEVIDRAVNFAARNGYRMIWIDQVSPRCRQS